MQYTRCNLRDGRTQTHVARLCFLAMISSNLMPEHFICSVIDANIPHQLQYLLWISGHRRS